jgi:hypothetical protein
MDEETLAKMEELVDKELSKYICPPSGNRVKVKASISFVDVKKVSEAPERPEWTKPISNK